MFVLRTKAFAAFATLTLSLAAVSSAHATTLFSDTFQGPLSPTNWASNGSGVIVTNPGGFAGNGLAFTGPGSGGDLFSVSPIAGTGAGVFTLSFDVLGNCGNTSQCGGFIGIDQYPGGEHWVTSDTPYGDTFGPTIQFADSSTWQTVTVTFTAVAPFRLKLEDFGGAANFASESIFFRNLQLNDSTAVTPEPGSLSLLGIGLAGVGLLRRRFSRS